MYGQSDGNWSPIASDAASRSWLREARRKRGVIGTRSSLAVRIGTTFTCRLDSMTSVEERADLRADQDAG